MATLTLSFSVRTTVRKRLNLSSSTSTGVRRRYSQSFTVQTGAMHYVAAASNSATDSGNTFFPTLIITPTDTYVTNSSTSPPGGTVYSYPYVKVDTNAVVGTCGLQDFHMELSLGTMGRFEAITQTSIGNKGDIITVAGLKALITYTGQGSSPTWQVLPNERRLRGCSHPQQRDPSCRW